MHFKVIMLKLIILALERKHSLKFREQTQVKIAAFEFSDFTVLSLWHELYED